MSLSLNKRKDISSNYVKASVFHETSAIHANWQRRIVIFSTQRRQTFNFNFRKFQITFSVLENFNLRKFHETSSIHANRQRRIVIFSTQRPLKRST
jgi:hypothetical protein